MLIYYNRNTGRVYCVVLKLKLPCLKVEFSLELGVLNLGWTCLLRPPLRWTASPFNSRLLSHRLIQRSDMRWERILVRVVSKCAVQCSPARGCTWVFNHSKKVLGNGLDLPLLQLSSVGPHQSSRLAARIDRNVVHPSNIAISGQIGVNISG